MPSLASKILSGAFWSAGGQLLVLLVGLITNVWLARILFPEEFGQLGIIMFFIVISTVLAEGGLVGALVRKKDPTPADYSTVFIVNLLMSIFLYGSLFIGSPFIADYYGDEELSLLLKVSGLVLIINAFQIKAQAKLQSDLRFKVRILYRLISVIMGSVVGIVAGYNGMGVWALVMMQLCTSLSMTLMLQFFEPMRLALRFSITSFKELFGFGVNTTLALMLDTAFDNIYQLVLGKYFNLGQVGYYYQAKKLQEVPGGLFNMVAQTVFFPTLSKLQDDKPKFNAMFQKLNRVYMVAMGLICCLLYVYSPQLIDVLYGEKWQDSAFYLQLLAIVSFFFVLERLNRVIFKVFNRTKIILTLELVKKVLHSISIVIGIIYQDLEVLLVGFIVISGTSYIITYFYSRKLAEAFSVSELKVLMGVIVLALLSVLATSVFNTKLGLVNDLALLSLPIMTSVYLGLMHVSGIFRLDENLRAFKTQYTKSP